MLERNSDDVRWHVKVGTVVNNGAPANFPVWVSSDRALVLPMTANGNAKVAVGSRIRMLASIWNACSNGDTGTITGTREDKEAAPKSWFVMMDKGCASYIFDGEFEVVS